jgi:hypothetical protein
MSVTLLRSFKLTQAAMKRRWICKQIILALPLMFIWVIPAISQTDDTHQEEKSGAGSAKFSFGADLVSRYVWRGKDYGNSPAIQPNVAFSVAGLKVGVWGSYSMVYNPVTGNYAEFDPYISYTYKWFTLGITDYFATNGISPNDNKYFNYNSKTTWHTYEACLSFNGTEKVPLQIYVGTLFYGADKGKDSTGVYGLGTDNNYSTYLEASYQFYVKGIGVKPFIGGIPFGSAWYGPYGGVINCGFTLSKSLKLSKEYELPLFASVVGNPQAQNVFLVFGLSF